MGESLAGDSTTEAAADVAGAKNAVESAPAEGVPAARGTEVTGDAEGVAGDGGSPETDTGAAAAEANVSALAPTATGKERRRDARYDCPGEVEILRVKEATGIIIRGKIRNLSLGGCYVETESPLERGAQLAVVLKIDALKLRVIAEVRSVKMDSHFWAGLEFAGMTAQGFESLKTLIAAFSAKAES
jgi:PilZ domain